METLAEIWTNLGAALSSSLFTAADPSKAAVALPAVLDLGAVTAGAVSGALEGCDRKLDIVGVCTLALVTALGGGLIRDAILSSGSVYMLDTPMAIVLSLVIALAAFFFAGLFYKLDRPIAVFDIISVALFTVSGTDKTITLGYTVLPCLLMGLLTGVGGGVVRDICLGRIPNIFRSSNFYAVCSIAGALSYWLLVEAHVTKLVAAFACVVVVVGLRWLSLRYNIVTVGPVDLTPKLMGPIAQLRQRAHERAREREARAAEAARKAEEAERARIAGAAGTSAAGDAAGQSDPDASEAPTAQQYPRRQRPHHRSHRPRSRRP